MRWGASSIARSLAVGAMLWRDLSAERMTPRRRHHGGARPECRENDPQGMEALMAGDAERVIVIGAGHNGLVAAFYLAKAGYAPLVLERAAIAGGSAITEEIHPGIRCPVLFDISGPLLPEIERDMQLVKQGVETISSEVQTVALHPDGSAIRIYTDPARTASELERISTHDGRKFSEFHSTF